MTKRTMTKLAAGDIVDPRTLMAMTGQQVPVPDSARLKHIQFRRFAGCPICNLHLRSFVTGAAAIEAAGVDEIVPPPPSPPSEGAPHDQHDR